MTTHWYMLNNFGMATLCADEADALRAAEESELMWPHNGPHRAMQLIDASQYHRDIPALRRLCSERDQLRAEVKRLTGDLREGDELRERLGDLLRRTAIALRGPEPPLTRWSWHDVPELVRDVVAELDRKRGPIRTSEVIDWKLTTEQIQAQYRDMAQEVERLRGIIGSEIRGDTFHIHPSTQPGDFNEPLVDLLTGEVHYPHVPGAGFMEKG